MYTTTTVASVSPVSVYGVGRIVAGYLQSPDTVHHHQPGSMNVRTRVYSGTPPLQRRGCPPRTAEYLPVQRRGLQHPRSRLFFRKRFAGRCHTRQTIHLHCHTESTLHTSHFTHNASNNKLRCHTSHRTLQLETCYTGLGSVTSLVSRSHMRPVLCDENFELHVTAQNECSEPPSLQ